MKKEKNNFEEYIKSSKGAILITIFFLILSFGQRLISDSFSMDTEFYIEHYLKDYTWWLGLDRWGLVLINKILSIGPLVLFQSNFMTIVLIALYSILFSYLFYLYIPKKWRTYYLKIQFILPIIFITNPIFAEQYNFINQNVAVALGICFIALSQIIQKEADNLKNKSKIILNIISIMISTITFGIYQAMIPLYILIVACTYLLECIKNKNSCWKFLIDRIIKFVIICILYLIICKIIGGENSYLQSGWATEGINCFKYIYYVIVDMLKCNTIFYNISFLIAICIMIIINIYLFVKKKNNIGILLSSIGILMSPFYIMIITGVDQLKRTQFNYSFVIGFILMLGCLYLINTEKLKKIAYLIVILSLSIAYKQANITGKLFHSDNIRFKNDTILATNIQNDIENQEWYDKTQKYTLVILGQQPCKSNSFYEKGEVIGYSFFEFDYKYYYGPSQRANAFMKTLGYDYKEPSKETFDKAKEYIKKEKINIYPSNNSIVKIKDNVIIIRLSEEI